jgi:glycosyltransferase involved in cell wall biosynthesis
MGNSEEALFIIGSNVISGAEYVLGDYIRNSSFSNQMTLFHADFEQGNSFYSKLPVKETKAFKELNPVGAKKRTSALRILQKAIKVLIFRIKLKRILSKSNFGVVIGNNTGDILYLGKSIKQKKILYVHDDISKQKIFQFVMKKFGRNIDQFIVVSNAVKLPLQKIGIPEKKIFTVYNGLENKHIPTSERSGGKDSLVFLFVGRLTKEKDPQTAIEFCTMLQSKSNNGVELYLVYNLADPEIHNIVLQLQSKYAGLLKITLLPDVPRDKLENFYKSADFLIHPTLDDALPTCILEAFQHGVPVIARKVGGVPELVEDGFNGFLFENEQTLLGEGNDISDSIVNRVLNFGEEQYVQMSENALATFTSRFTLDKKVALLDQLLFAQQKEEKL